MFTICTRCQFRMPVRSRLCSICGNERTIHLVEEIGHSDLDDKIGTRAIGNHVKDVLFTDLPAVSHRLVNAICSQVAWAGQKCRRVAGKIRASFLDRTNNRKLPKAVLQQTEDKPSKPSDNSAASAPAAPVVVPSAPAARTQPRTYYIVGTTQESQAPAANVEPELTKARFKQAFEAAAARQKLDELQGWFEDYGRNGIIKNHSAAQNDISKSA